MDANLQTQLAAAAFAVAIVSLFFSLVAAFPGLKGVVAAVRDGVLWCALFLVVGGVGFIAWQRVQQMHGLAAVVTPGETPVSPAAADAPALSAP